MQIISAGSSLIFLQADLSKTSNNRLPILSKMEIILLNSLADPKSGSSGSALWTDRKNARLGFFKKYSAHRTYDEEVDHSPIRKAMSGKFLTLLSAKVRAELKQNLKNNAVYKRHRWSLPERVQVYCSTHYLRAMLFLWTAAAGAVIAAEYFRPVFHSFAVTYLKGVTVLPAWMSNLLGAQLTIIGIVFPLVVGLISVLFQKKSSRIHIQSAYR